MGVQYWIGAVLVLAVIVLAFAYGGPASLGVGNPAGFLVPESWDGRYLTYRLTAFNGGAYQYEAVKYFGRMQLQPWGAGGTALLVNNIADTEDECLKIGGNHWKYCFGPNDPVSECTSTGQTICYWDWAAAWVAMKGPPRVPADGTVESTWQIGNCQIPAEYTLRSGQYIYYENMEVVCPATFEGDKEYGNVGSVSGVITIDFGGVDPPCEQDWQCTGWGDCQPGDIQERQCTDWNGCGTLVGKPAEEQPCVYVPPVVPECTLPEDCDYKYHIPCIGEWTCVEGDCIWVCFPDQPECTTDDDCAGECPDLQQEYTCKCMDGSCEAVCTGVCEPPEPPDDPYIPILSEIIGLIQGVIDWFVSFIGGGT